ncbi:DUF7122 family protein [Halococcoides cellulosivorans]|uniref:Uncharacterized protein n=1 Tax=Halococcoides cellulosivorans TaxID=1679096 RepID=A0A2R4X0L5_9EURY|nr:hypothetical protein [Halococcoides cellulosivorans]AWB27303.1 hypothetical protein HARCEL1_06105 [Halococcoides cellulosivorans]
MTDDHVGTRFDRVAKTEAERDREHRPSRAAICEFFAERFGIEPAVFDEYSFWERGKGKIWAFRGDLDSPVEIEALGMVVLRADQKHWKPTTSAAQQFGAAASECVVNLDETPARRFLAGDSQDLDWDGDWGYVIVTHDLDGERIPIGVGLYLHGELRSQLPTGRQRDLDAQ